LTLRDLRSACESGLLPLFVELFGLARRRRDLAAMA